MYGYSMSVANFLLMVEPATSRRLSNEDVGWVGHIEYSPPSPFSGCHIMKNTHRHLPLACEPLVCVMDKVTAMVDLLLPVG